MSAVQHESSQLIVVSAVIDGHVCQDVLVDAGASSNFVREDWVKSTRLSTRRMRETLKVTLADGKVAAQLTHAVQVRSLEMQGSSAPCTLTVMGQLSHQVIVGLPWLRRAGVTIDYEHMQWNGQPIDQGKLKTTPGAQLQGLTVGPEHTKRMDAILAQYPAAFSKDLRPRSAATAVPAALGVAAAAVVVTCATTSTAARAIGRGAVSRISAAAVARRATRPLSARARAAPPVSRRPRRLQRHQRPHQRKAPKVRRRSV